MTISLVDASASYAIANNVSHANPYDFTLTYTPTATGDYLILHCAWWANVSGAGSVAVSDDVDGAWTVYNQDPASGSPWNRCAVAFIKCSSTALRTVTVTLTQSTSSTWYRAAHISEWSGIKAISPVDQQLGTGSAGTTNTLDLADVTTTNANDVVLASFGHWGGSAFTSPTSPWIQAAQHLLTNTDMMAALYYQIVGATGAFGPVFTVTNSNAECCAGMVLALQAEPPAGNVYNVETDESLNADDASSAGGFKFVAAGTLATGANPAPGIPAGSAAGDILVCCAASATAYSSTPPAGWTQLVRYTTADPMLTAWWKVATGSDSAPTLTNASTKSKAQIIGYRATRQLTDMIGAIATGSSTSPRTGAQNTTTSGALVLSLYAAAGVTTSRTWSTPAGTTARINSGTTTSTLDGIFVCDENQPLAGAITRRTATLSGSLAWNAVAIAFQVTQQSDAFMTEEIDAALDASDTQISYHVASAESASGSDAQTVVGGGTVYNLARAEAESVADAPAAQVGFKATGAESVTAADAPAAQAAFQAVGAEAVTGTDSQAGQQASAVSVPETASAADQPAASASTAAAGAEAVTAQDAQNYGAATWALTGLESVSGVDLASAQAIFAAIGAEAVSAVDVATAVAAFKATAAEAVTASDATAGLLATGIAIGEALTATDAATALAIFAAATAEIGTMLDVASSGSSTYGLTAAESATAADAAVAIKTWTTSVLESGSVTDVQVPAVLRLAASLESVSAIDALFAQVAFQAVVAEVGSVLDAIVAVVQAAFVQLMAGQSEGRGLTADGLRNPGRVAAGARLESHHLGQRGSGRGSGKRAGSGNSGNRR